MEREMQRFLQHVAGAKPHACYLRTTVWEPPLNLYLTASAVVVLVEVAGALRDTLDVTVDNGELVVRGCREEPALPDLVNHYQVEMHFGKFERRVALPGAVEPEHTTASYRDGLLRIMVPLAKPRTLTVEARAEEVQ